MGLKTFYVMKFEVMEILRLGNGRKLLEEVRGRSITRMEKLAQAIGAASQELEDPEITEDL